MLLGGYFACKTPVVKKPKEVLKQTQKNAATKKIIKKKKKKGPKEYFDYNDIFYVKDYRTKNCYAIHAKYGGLGNVVCDKDVEKLIKNEK